MRDALEVIGPTGSRWWTRAELTAVGPDHKVRVVDILGDRADATHVSFETHAGDYRASIPLDVVESQAIIIHSSEAGPLDIAAGGPYRLLVPEGRTLCWHVKGLARLRMTVGPEPDSVPEKPPH